MVSQVLFLCYNVFSNSRKYKRMRLLLSVLVSYGSCKQYNVENSTCVIFPYEWRTKITLNLFLWIYISTFVYILVRVFISSDELEKTLLYFNISFYFIHSCVYIKKDKYRDSFSKTYKRLWLWSNVGTPLLKTIISLFTTRVIITRSAYIFKK
jgi:hypothetical protein